MQRDELKARARELERAAQHEKALELYSRLAEKAENGPSASDLVRLGDLNARAGRTASAADCYLRAAELFGSAGLINNEIATRIRLRETAPDTPGVHRRLADLAIEQGYRDLAHSSALAALRAGSGSDAEGAIELIAEYIRRFPDNGELWREWIAGVRAERGAEEVVRVLPELLRALEKIGTPAADTIRNEIERLSPAGAPARGQPEAARDSAESIGGSMTEEGNTPIVDSFSTESVDEGQITPLAGLEPTNLADEPELDEVAPDALPLLDPTGALASEAEEAAGEAAEPPSPIELDLEHAEDEELSSAEPLPLLGGYDVSELGAEPSPALAHAGAADQSMAKTATEAPPAGEALADSLDLAAIAADLSALTRREVDPADPVTHHDLGIAFKEMGLLDVSLAQFAAAIEGRHNPAASLEVVGEILVGQGDNEAATRVLRHVSAVGEVHDEELVGVLYWLGRGEEGLGDRETAARLLDRVIAVDPVFRDASDRLDRLRTGGP